MIYLRKILMAEEKKEDGADEVRKDAAQESKDEQTEEQGNPNDGQETADAVRERLVRLAAEFDNYKKRVAKEIEGSKNVGKAEAISRILPSLDELELAMAAMNSDGKDRGIKLVYSNLVNALKSLGLKEIEVDGKFDPYKHEIMLAKASKENEGTILEVVRKGYTLNGIMLRPASVIVSNGSVEEKNKEENTGETK